MEQLSTRKSHPYDIVQIVKDDHRNLKALLSTLKDDNEPYLKKQEAFQKLALLLEAHIGPELETWYKCLKYEHRITVEISEGELEHRLALQICKDMEATTSEGSFMLKARVLAEMALHQIMVEERDLLPELEVATTLDKRIELGLIYLEMQRHIEVLQNSEHHLYPHSSPDQLQ
ncbi:hemerythrin domain-containing protein [Bdellovibrio sp. HCB288]|uniref:hemerythrin domain-containing protein n=1 Tax=Bdellovibrio sp. HCB288 TaxID=3394355 RepID=UPI0039B3D9BE